MKPSGMSARRPSRGEAVRERMLRDVASEETSGRARRLSVEVGVALARRIKIHAAQEDRTISEITRELWVAYLKNCELQQ